MRRPDRPCRLFVIGAALALVSLLVTGCVGSLAGQGTVRGYAGDDGPATKALLRDPHGVLYDAAGNLYIADTSNHAIRKVDTHGIITTIAGGNGSGYSGDGGPAVDARFTYPTSLAWDGAGNLFVGDRDNYAVRKISASGIITTVAGGNGQGSSGDGGPATRAQLMWARGITFDAAGNLYIADRWSSIRKVDTAGIISTFAGRPEQGYTGDGGPATSAHLNRPRWVAFDRAGNLLIADYGNQAIRRVDRNGIIRTIAGGNGIGYSGDGGLAVNAQLYHPSSIAIDPAGAIVFTEHENHCVRRISPRGIITTIAGGNGPGYTPNGTYPPTEMQLNRPSGVTFAPDGSLVIADRLNDVVRVANYNASNQPD
jgi:sugar lactone lactonase YvrE